MQEVFKKIIEKLEELQNYACFPTEWVNEEQSKIHSFYANKLTEILKLAEYYNNGWIPCSERLPENISTVILQVEEIEKPTFGFYGNMNGWRLTEKDFVGLKDFTVIAWQPLPPEYQPKGE